MLTPAFHFKILEDFTPVMNEQSNILVNNLRNACNKPFIDIREPIVQCTLDVICGMFCLNILIKLFEHLIQLQRRQWVCR